MNKAKILRGLSAAVKLLGLLAGFNQVPFVKPEWGILIVLFASAAKDSVSAFGDLLDDGKKNGSFAGLVLALFLALGSVGCVQYVSPDGSRLTSFLQKSTFEGLRVSPKTGLSVKSAETSGDTEFIRSVYEAGKSAASKAAP